MATTRSMAKGNTTSATTSDAPPPTNSGSPPPTNSGSPLAHSILDSAATSSMATLAIRAASGPGPGHSRGQRPTSPIATALSPPPHMQHLAPFWAEMSADLQFKLRSRDIRREKQEEEQKQRAMKGLETTVVRPVPLSQQDKAGNTFLRLCDFISWGTSLAALFAILLDVVLLCTVELKGAEATLHCFGIPMALAIILAEREMAVLLGLCSFLESWLFKGFYISYVGTLLLAFDHGDIALDLWRRVGGMILIAMGVLYVFLGALCFRQLRSRQLGKIRRKKEMKQELEALSNQKQEIEKLLADTETKLERL